MIVFVVKKIKTNEAAENCLNKFYGTFTQFVLLTIHTKYIVQGS